VTSSGLHTIALAPIAVAIAVLALYAFDRRLPWRALGSETGQKQHETGSPTMKAIGKPSGLADEPERPRPGGLHPAATGRRRRTARLGP
jgi:hypothetical protein